jgi:hypothetical protein
MRSLLIVALLVAHHATAVQYDTSTTVTLKGSISKLDWSNPHIHVYLDVKTADSRSESWDIELASPGGVIVAGLSRDLLKVGSVITIKGYPSKSAKSPHSACATDVILEDGTTAHFVVGI